MDDVVRAAAASPARATPCCSRPPARRWTCSATTPRAATRSPPRCAGCPAYGPARDDVRPEPRSARTGRAATAPPRPGTADAAPTVALLHRPATPYYLLLGASTLLLVLGLVMVLSASSVVAFAFLGSSMAFVSKQAMLVVIGLPLMWCASRLPVRGLAAVGLRRLWSTSLAAAGARRRRRHRGQRQPELARLRRAVPHPAVRAGQARARRCGAPTCWPARSGCSASGGTSLVPLVPGRRPDPRRSSCSAATSAPRSSSRRPRRAALGRRRAAAAVPRGGGAGRCSSSRYMVNTRSTRMSRITVWLHPDQADPLGNGLPGAARPVRARLRRLVGRRPRRPKEKWGSAARGAHRLHLRDHRRGARPARHARRARAVRRCSATPGCGSRSSATDPFVRLAAAGVTAWMLGAGARQHRRGDRPAAGHRRAAAAGVVRRVGAGAHDARARHAAVLRPAAGPPGAAVCCDGSAARGQPAGRRGSRARRPRRGRDRRPHRACPGPRRRAAPARPGGRGHRPGHRARPGDPARPGPRLRPGADPAGAAAAPPGTSTCSRARPAAGRRRRGGRGAAASAGPTCWSASAATCPARPTSRPGGCGSRSSCTRRTRGRAGPTGSAPGSRRTSPPPSPARRSRTAGTLGLPLRREIATLDRAAPPRRGARAPSAWTPTGRPCWSPAARRARGGSTTPRPVPPPTCAPPACRCCTSPAPRNAVEVGRPGGARRTSSLPYLDRMELAYAAADLVLCRAGANTVVELTAVGLPAAYVPLPIGNGEQELNAAPGRRRRRRAAGRRRRLHRRLGARHPDPAAHRPGERLATMGRAAAAQRAAGRRRAAGRPGARGGGRGARTRGGRQ